MRYTSTLQLKALFLLIVGQNKSRSVWKVRKNLLSCPVAPSYTMYFTVNSTVFYL